MTPLTELGRQAIASMRDRVVLVAAVLGLTVPFLATPYHIDDDIYLKGAQQILRTPWSPLGGTQKMLGEVMPTYHFTQHPPLVSYLIALVDVTTGGLSEIRLHLAFLVFPLLAALAFHGLARRFTRHPLEASLLLVGTPVFLVSSHGIMTDLPFLALALSATAAFVQAVDGRGARFFAAGGLLLALACFTQYRGLMLAPLLVGYAWLQGRRRAQAAGATAPALLLVGLWSLSNARDLGVVHLSDAGSWIAFAPDRMIHDAIAYVALVGGVTLFPLFLLWALRRTLARADTGIAVVAATAAAAVSSTQGYGVAQTSLFVVFLVSGIVTTWAFVPSRQFAVRYLAALRVLPAGEPVRDELFLVGMVSITLLSQVVLNLFASARSILLAAPFLVLLLVRRIESQVPAVVGARRTLRVGVALTVACGLAISIADYQFAVAERDLARSLKARLAGQGRVWFSGEWGFRHYMEKAGFEYATVDGTGTVAGDLLVMPEVPCPAALAPTFSERLRLEDAVVSERRFPIKIMSFQDRAGFYSNFHGLLPYSFSRRPLESARVFRIAALE